MAISNIYEFPKILVDCCTCNDEGRCLGYHAMVISLTGSLGCVGILGGILMSVTGGNSTGMLVAKVVCFGVAGAACITAGIKIKNFISFARDQEAVMHEN